MKITKLGHACLFIEEGEARILLDPGAFSQGFEDLAELDAILITHQHQDHMVPANIQALVAKSPGVMVRVDEGSAKLLAEAGVEAQVVHAGDTFEVKGVTVEVFGRDHAVIHPEIPGIPDVGYMVAERFFYPGDAFTVPGKPVEVLAAPAGAPWLKISEAMDYLVSVKPKVAIPVHDAVLSDIGRQIHFGALEGFGKQAGVELRVVENGSSIEV